MVYLSYYGDIGLFITLHPPVAVIGLSREHLFTMKDRKLETELLFDTLSDARRREILRLVAHKRWYSNELARHFGLSAATMSYHITKLVSSGMLSVEEGEQKRLYYVLNRDQIGVLLRNATEDFLDGGS